MSRIRTVKPELFKHEELFDAEITSGLPLRLAFIGLFTVADREGRFRWKPRTLKLDVLPHDATDFTAVLNALETAGFIRRYEVDGHSYGWIPTFTKHQRFSGKEAELKSELPPPPEGSDGEVPECFPGKQWGSNGETMGKQTGSNGEATGKQTGTQERNKGRERNKGKERSMAERNAPTRKTPCPADLAITPELQEWATANGYQDLERHLDAFKDKANAKGYQYADWQAALRNAIRDDWAGLRKPAPPPDRPQSAAPLTPEGARFAALLDTLTHPVIEGELTDAVH